MTVVPRGRAVDESGRVFLAATRTGSWGAQSAGTAHEPGASQAFAAKVRFCSCTDGPPARANNATKHDCTRQSAVPAAVASIAEARRVPATTPAASEKSTVLRCSSHPSLGLSSGGSDPRKIWSAVGSHSTNTKVEPGVVPVATTDMIWSSTRPVEGMTV